MSSGKDNQAEGRTVIGADSDTNEKTEWPELVGKSVDEAKKVILKDMPEVKIMVLPAGSIVTMDYRTEHVRLFVDIVAEVPRIG